MFSNVASNYSEKILAKDFSLYAFSRVRKYANIKGPIRSPKTPNTNIPPTIPINTITCGRSVFWEIIYGLRTVSIPDVNIRL